MWKFFGRGHNNPKLHELEPGSEAGALANALGYDDEKDMHRNIISIGGEAGALVVARTVTQEECEWLHEDVQAGELVYRFVLATYGVCNLDDGIPVSRQPNEYPFFELPRDSLVGEVDYTQEA